MNADAPTLTETIVKTMVAHTIGYEMREAALKDNYCN